MEGASDKIKSLIEVGDQLTYMNFADLEPNRRWVVSYRPQWVSWTTRTAGAIKALFGEDSAQYTMVEQGQRVSIIRNGQDNFELAKAFFMGALHSARDILADDVFGEVANSQTASAPLTASNRVFVVHGRDDVAKSELELILREFGLEPVVLHRQADAGKTIIEKFEHYSDVGYAFIILTPDEVAYLSAEESKSDELRTKEYRARPNAIFEFGFFVGKLGRARTCCLYKSPVVVPSDLNGLVYKRFERSIEEVAYSMRKELQAAGYKLM